MDTDRRQEDVYGLILSLWQALRLVYDLTAYWHQHLHRHRHTEMERST